MKVYDVEQGTDEWRQLRCGLPTASRFKDILAEGKGLMRSKYMRQLAGELVSGRPMETFKNQYMERGNAMEDEARAMYAFMTDTEPQRVGFVKNNIAGCSPDSFLGDDGVLELKTALPDILIEHIIADRFPSEHAAQCQGALLVCKRQWVDIAIYCPGMPLFVKRASRDQIYLKNLDQEIKRFNAELLQTVAKIKSYRIA